MDFGLRGKTALVTGSTAGIGLAAAIGLAREGTRVIVSGRSGERVAQARTRILAAVPEAIVLGAVADLSTAEGANAVVREHPSVDVLVNNVGVFEPKAFADITDEDWLRFFQTNVMSGVRLSRAYFPAMMKGGWGRIVFVSSESAVQIPVEMIHYGTTKTAQLAVARGLAEMTSGSGVTVNTVLPGPTYSEGVGRFVADLAKRAGDRREDDGEGVLHPRSSQLAPSAIRDHRGGREHDRLRLQYGRVGDERRRASRGTEGSFEPFSDPRLPSQRDAPFFRRTPGAAVQGSPSSQVIIVFS